MGRRVRRPGGARERAPLFQAALDLVRAARGLACRLGEQKGLAAEPGAIIDAVLRISMQPAQDADEQRTDEEPSVASQQFEDQINREFLAWQHSGASDGLPPGPLG